jgi:hypothetical protein
MVVGQCRHNFSGANREQVVTYVIWNYDNVVIQNSELKTKQVGICLTHQTTIPSVWEWKTIPGI